MKIKSITFLLLFLYVCMHCTAESKPNIQGVWKLISSKSAGKNVKLNQLVMLKHIEKKSYFWFSCNPKTKIIRNSISGSYTFDGKYYTESVDYVGLGSTKFLNSKHKFKVEINADKMHLTGVLSDKAFIEQIWLRVE